MATPIKLSKVTKYYGNSKVAAVHNLSLSLQPGEVYGLLGANGAGKTTALRLIMDFIRPSSGTIELFGKNNQQGGAGPRGKIGYLPGEVVLPKGLKGQEFLNYLGKLNHKIDHAYTMQLAKKFGAQLDKKMNQLSKGNRQKIAIVQAFMHQPDILVLDEPTSGLDPLMQEQFYHLINQVCQRGATILLSSHSFEEVERTCDRIGIVRHGKLVYEGPTTDIIASQKPRWRVTFKSASDAAKLKSNPALKVFDFSKNSLTLEPAGSIQKALAILSQQAIVSMTSSQHGLEDEFLHFYEEEA